jgi:hypothetical protein
MIQAHGQLVQGSGPSFLATFATMARPWASRRCSRCAERLKFLCLIEPACVSVSLWGRGTSRHVLPPFPERSLFLGVQLPLAFTHGLALDTAKVERPLTPSS